MKNPYNPMFERISDGQFFCVVMLYTLGTTWLYLPGSDTGRDAWIAALMGLASGLLLTLLYVRLADLFPNESMAEWLPRLCGPFLGRLLTVVYIIYFVYIAARDLRDIAELLRLSFLPRTPISAIVLMQGLAVALACYYGFEVSVRAKQLLLPVVLVMLGISLIGLLPRIYPPHLFPLLEYGPRAVWRHAFPVVTTVPYGELVVYLMLMQFVVGNRARATLSGVGCGGIVLVVITLLGVLVIGPANMAASTLPFYALVRSITVGDVIQRLDGLVVPMLAFGAYAKASSILLAATYGLARLQGARRPGVQAIALGVLAAGWGVAMADNFLHHLKIGLEIVPYALHIPLQILVPLGLWLLAEVRHRKGPLPRKVQGPRLEVPPKWSSITLLVVALIVWGLALSPLWRERAHLAERFLPPLGHWVGDPIARLLGGRPMGR